MKLYYTGAINYNDVQADKDTSLGGYKSSTLVPNGSLGNFFGPISMYGLDDKLRETRAIIIHNDTVGAYTNVFFYFDKLVGAIGTFEVAAVLIAPNVDNEIQMESIGSIRALPFTGTFTPADTVANQVLLSASMAADEYIGLWITRIIKDADKDQFDCDTMYDNLIADPVVPQVTEGQVNMTLAWT